MHRMTRGALALRSSAIFGTSMPALGAADAPPMRMPQLKAAAQITQDTEGIYHVRANNEADAFFLQGWVHARDRLFQMDQNRRLASDAIPPLPGHGEGRPDAVSIEKFVPA